jgi:PH (Pleckstrin Homology) domain-containing protein
MDVFKSKIDKWMLIFIVLSMFSCMLGSSVMLKIGGAVNYSIAAFILIVGAGIPLWILVSTKYIVEKENLEIISGPFSWIIPITSIKYVREFQSSAFSPALSSDRLEITYGEDKVMMISPADKIKFMQKLDNEKLTSTGKDTQQQAAGRSAKRSSRKAPKKHVKDRTKMHAQDPGKSG